jgi:CheY-like chemotaxis protein
MNCDIILIDDDNISLFLHTKVIENCQFQARSIPFRNSTHAIEYIRNNVSDSQQYIILLDLNMPAMNGWEVLKTLEQLPYKQNLDVLIVSSSIDLADHLKAKDFPIVSQFIKKPLTLEKCDVLRERVA